MGNGGVQLRPVANQTHCLIPPPPEMQQKKTASHFFHQRRVWWGVGRGYCEYMGGFLSSVTLSSAWNSEPGHPVKPTA